MRTEDFRDGHEVERGATRFVTGRANRLPRRRRGILRLVSGIFQQMGSLWPATRSNRRNYSLGLESDRCGAGQGQRHQWLAYNKRAR